MHLLWVRGLHLQETQNRGEGQHRVYFLHTQTFFEVNKKNTT